MKFYITTNDKHSDCINVVALCDCDHCSGIRILRFFHNSKTRFLRFLEMTCQKNVKENVIKVSVRLHT